MSQKVCGNGTGTNCGTAQTNNGKLGTVFSTESTDAISAESNTISLQGMATNINNLNKEGKAVAYQSLNRLMWHFHLRT
ncbi:hypothetical protein [Anaplasma centrale]|uniref:hypothetical protein n=1 Tax=Anaplasma centrale TaxID=769 RepID=UPI002367D3F7|nr:hypothetical protein [Anaplasma centrale]